MSMTANPVLDLRERDLQKQVRAFAEGLGWKVAVTWNSLHSPKGWPDLFCVRGDEAVAIELKAEKGKVSEYQQAWIDALAGVPGVKFSGVIRPSDWYAGALDAVLGARGRGVKGVPP